MTKDLKRKFPKWKMVFWTLLFMLSFTSSILSLSLYLCWDKVNPEQAGQMTHDQVAAFAVSPTLLVLVVLICVILRKEYRER